MLKIGKFYKTIETPHGVVLGYKADPTQSLEHYRENFGESHVSPANNIIHVKSGIIALVVEAVDWTSGDINELFFKAIIGDDFVWLHPYDLVEIDEDGMPIVSKEF